MQFDLITAAGSGYQWVWLERHYLLKLALLPVFVKSVCSMAALALGYDAQDLSYALVMLPAFFAEGWIVAQAARTQITNERWPIPMPPPELIDDSDIEKLIPRARAILACIITFVLLKMLSQGMATFGLFLMSHVEPQAASSSNDVLSSTGGLIALAIMIFAIWAFRFVYIYVGMVVLMPVRNYIKLFPHFISSVKLLALWLITNVPGLFLVMIISGFLIAPYGDPSLIPAGMKFVLMIFAGITEMLLSLVATAAFVAAFSNVLKAYYKK
ncbi:MAG: hypothetical protein GC136_00640 [Alphaproteobacteria bacterium]|nr:hypothetical protein [Alphaproteobacteria bacterium]